MYLLLPNVVLSQPTEGSWFSISPKDGLSETTNSFIHKDSYGFIWIASVDGLNRFDGRNINVFRHDPSDTIHSVAGNIVQSRFWEDYQGNIWFSTEVALNCYQRNTGDYEHFFMDSGKRKQVHQILGMEKKCFLWIFVDTTLYRFDIKNKISTPIQSLYSPFNILKTNANGQSDGIVSYNWSSPGIIITLFNENFKISKTINQLDGKSSKFTADVYQCSILQDILWLATSKGIISIEGTDYSIVKHYPNPSAAPKVMELGTMANNRLAVLGENSGFNIFDTQNRKYVLDKGKPIFYPTNNPVLTAQEDLDNVFWCSILQEGVYFKNLNKSSFQISQTSTVKNLLGNPINQIANDEHENGGITIHTKWEEITIDNNKERVNNLGKSAKTILHTKENQYWLVCENIISLWSQQYHQKMMEWPLENFSPNLSGIVYEDKLIFSTYSGLYWLDKQSTSPHLIQKTENPVVSFYIDPLGRLWAGSDVGLKMYNITEPFALREEASFGNTNIVYQVLYDTATKKVWAATSSGILQIDETTKSYKRISFKNGIMHPMSVSIVQDRAGKLWAGTSQGLYHFDPNYPEENKVYTTAHGLNNTSFNDDAALVAPNGHIWMGGNNGLDVFDPIHITLRGHAPQLAITGLKVHDQAWRGDTSIEMLRHLHLPYNENTLRLEMAAMEYLDPARNQFRVMLHQVGEKGKWTDLGTQNFVTYANLKPGKYIFRFIACNAEGIWVEDQNARTLYIHIHPHWSQTWWFRTLLGLSILGFVAGGMAFYYRYRLRKQQLDNEKQQREAERQRLELEKTVAIAEEHRKTAESEMKLLRAQLNPHFLFNAMNSVNSYILSNEKEKASEYLGDFARLTRSILDNSRNLNITLAEELKMLDRYLRLENHRFGQQITWKIDIDPDLDEEDIQVPSMFLQPFVENAILHGLAPKGGGLIQITVGQQGEGMLCCTLRDNGVGRHASAPSGEGSTGPKRASVGMSLITDRLDAFASIQGGKAQVTVRDLKDPDGHPLGTEVEVLLPLESAF
jgi:ligand-binding sensor domain-containing protein/two-component sensor histidine kinase